MSDRNFSYTPDGDYTQREQRVEVNLQEGNKTHNAEDYWKETTVYVQASSNATGMSEGEIIDDFNEAMDTASKASGGGVGSKSTKSAKQEKDKKEIRTLQGNLVLRVNANTIKLQVGETVKLIGLGRYLSGLYYITGISRTLDSSGYNQTISVMKTDFTKTLKEVQVETVKSNVIQR